MNLAKILLFLVAALLMFACRQGPPAPQEPVWGKQPCAHCAMLVSRPESAAQYANAEGETWFFDDLGCLVSWQLGRKARLGEQAGEQAWVRQGAEWLEVGKARYVGGRTTPMDFGFVAEPGGTETWHSVQQAVYQRQKATALGR